MIVLKEDEVSREEDRIRKLVRDLSDSNRIQFYKRIRDRIKDPDTYATLNYFFIAGLHHFYLGRFVRGIVHAIVFWAGGVLLFIAPIDSNAFIIGTLSVVGITVIEFYALFRSQVIVLDYNNKLSTEVLETFDGQEP
jgi:hypothetical protein